MMPPSGREAEGQGGSWPGATGRLVPRCEQWALKLWLWPLNRGQCRKIPFCYIMAYYLDGSPLVQKGRKDKNHTIRSDFKQTPRAAELVLRREQKRMEK